MVTCVLAAVIAAACCIAWVWTITRADVLMRMPVRFTAYGVGRTSLRSPASSLGQFGVAFILRILQVWHSTLEDSVNFDGFGTLALARPSIVSCSSAETADRNDDVLVPPLSFVLSDDLRVERRMLPWRQGFVSGFPCECTFVLSSVFRVKRLMLASVLDPLRRRGR